MSFTLVCHRVYETWVGLKNVVQEGYRCLFRARKTHGYSLITTEKTTITIIAGVMHVHIPAAFSKARADTGFRPNWWLVDSGCGKTMTPYRADFVFLVEWTGGKVQVGDGAHHRHPN